MGKGNTTTTSSSSTSPNPQAAGLYSNLLNQIQSVAATPYQAYTGQLVAPVNAQQQTGIGNINANAGFATPYVQQAAGLATGAANPLSGAQIGQYMSPYTQNVVNATQAQFNNQNQQQQAQLTGNQIAQGALGGNRSAIAASNLAGQQQLAQAPVIAGLYNTGYQNALQTAAQQFQQNPEAAAGLVANFGISGQNAALAGANAQVGAGSLEQQTQQMQNQALLQQFEQQQAYPFQTAQWETNLGLGIGSQMGSTSTGTTQQPSPSPWGQIAGLGLEAAGMFLKDGGAVHRAVSGGVPGIPYEQSYGYVPTEPSQIAQELEAVQRWRMLRGGANFPRPSGDSGNSGLGINFKDLQAIGGNVAGSLGGPSYGGGNFLTDAYGGSSANPLPGLSAADYGSGFAKGGGVAGYRHYADGGGPDDGDISDADRAYGLSMLRQGMGGEEVSDADRSAGLEMLREKMPPTPESEAGLPVFDGKTGRMLGNFTSDQGAPTLSPGDGSAPAMAAPPPRAGLASEPPPMARPVAPAFSNPQMDVNPIQPKSDAYSFGAGYLSPDVKEALMAAGFGMMASRSPYPGVQIGEGGLAGLGAYNAAKLNEQKLRQQGIANAQTNRRIDVQADQLQEQAQRAADEFAIQSATEQERKRHDIATEGRLTPIGTAMVGNQEHPLGMTPDGQVIDLMTHKPPADTTQIAVKGAGAGMATISPETAYGVAKYTVETGDTSRLQGLGYNGANKALVNQYMDQVQKEENVSNQDYAQRVAEFQGRKSAQRVLGTSEARMGSAAFEAEGAIKLARPIIGRLPRTSFLPWNQLLVGFERQTLNPDQVELEQRLQQIKNTYSAVMARGANVTTDAARARTDELLSSAENPIALNRALDTMQSEIDMAKTSPEKMREFYRQMYGAQAVGPSTAAPTSAAPVTRTLNGKTYINRNGQWFQQ